MKSDCQNSREPRSPADRAGAEPAGPGASLLCDRPKPRVLSKYDPISERGSPRQLAVCRVLSRTAAERTEPLGTRISLAQSGRYVPRAAAGIPLPEICDPSRDMHCLRRNAPSGTFFCFKHRQVLAMASCLPRSRCAAHAVRGRSRAHHHLAPSLPGLTPESHPHQDGVTRTAPTISPMVRAISICSTTADGPQGQTWTKPSQPSRHGNIY